MLLKVLTVSNGYFSRRLQRHHRARDLLKYWFESTIVERCLRNRKCKQDARWPSCYFCPNFWWWRVAIGLWKRPRSLTLFKYCHPILKKDFKITPKTCLFFVSLSQFFWLTNFARNHQKRRNFDFPKNFAVICWTFLINCRCFFHNTFWKPGLVVVELRNCLKSLQKRR